MSITEALNTMRWVVYTAQDMRAKIRPTDKGWEEAMKDCDLAIHVIESYVQEKEGQGGLGL